MKTLSPVLLNSPHRAKIQNELKTDSDWGKLHVGHHLEPGIVTYDNPDGSQTVYLLTREAIAKMRPTAEGKPIVGLSGNYDHKKVSPEDFERGSVDGVAVESFDNPEAGWEDVRFIVWNADTKKKCQDGYQLSCAYVPTETRDEPGLWHNCKYDAVIANGEYTHFAVVPNPRYEGAEIYNSKSGGIVDKVLRTMLSVVPVARLREIVNAIEADEKTKENADEVIPRGTRCKLVRDESASGRPIGLLGKVVSGGSDKIIVKWDDRAGEHVVRPEDIEIMNSVEADASRDFEKRNASTEADMPKNWADLSPATRMQALRKYGYEINPVDAEKPYETLSEEAKVAFRKAFKMENNGDAEKTMTPEEHAKHEHAETPGVEKAEHEAPAVEGALPSEKKPEVAPSPETPPSEEAAKTTGAEKTAAAPTPEAPVKDGTTVPANAEPEKKAEVAPVAKTEEKNDAAGGAIDTAPITQEEKMARAEKEQAEEKAKEGEPRKEAPKLALGGGDVVADPALIAGGAVGASKKNAEPEKKEEKVNADSRIKAGVSVSVPGLGDVDVVWVHGARVMVESSGGDRKEFDISAVTYEENLNSLEICPQCCGEMKQVGNTGDVKHLTCTACGTTDSVDPKETKNSGGCTECHHSSEGHDEFGCKEPGCSCVSERYNAAPDKSIAGRERWNSTSRSGRAELLNSVARRQSGDVEHGFWSGRNWDELPENIRKALSR